MTPPAVDAVLARVARRHDVAVLAARDVGSRAWNLDDPASDRDVLALFVQRPSAYATLGEYVETFDYGFDSESDEADADAATADSDTNTKMDAAAVELRAWNVRRFAELVADSNPTAFEFLHTPLRYRAFDPLSALERDVGDAFRPIALYYHYRSLAERQYRKYLHGRLLEDGELAYLIQDRRDGEYLVRSPDCGGSRDEDGAPDVGDEAGDSAGVDELRWIDGAGYEEGETDRTVRRNLHVARGVLYARYVRETHRFPSLDFPAFLETEGDRFDASFVERTRELVDRKRAGEGDAVVGRVFDPDEIDLPEIDPDRHAVGGVDRERVNAFVRAALAAAPD